MISKIRILKNSKSILEAYKEMLPKLGCGLTLKSINTKLWGMVLEDASKPGFYKIQYFQEHGLNIHHSYKDIRDCLIDALENNCTEVDQGAIDRLAIQKEWEKGMVDEKVKERYKKRIISLKKYSN